MKLPLYVSLAAILSAQTLVAAPIDPANPPPEFTQLRDHLRLAGAIRCTMVETRKLPFRKEASTLSGTCAFINGKGLILSYTTPQSRTIALTPDTMLEVRNGKTVRMSIPAQYARMLPAYNLDLDSLGDGWQIDFTQKAQAWTLSLVRETTILPATKEQRVRVERFSITLEGDVDGINSIVIDKPGQIVIRTEMSDRTQLTGAELETLERMLTE